MANMDKVGLTPKELIELLKNYEETEHLRFVAFTDSLDNWESSRVITIEKVSAIGGKDESAIGATIMGIIR